MSQLKQYYVLHHTNKRRMSTAFMLWLFDLYVAFERCDDKLNQHCFQNQPNQKKLKFRRMLATFLNVAFDVKLLSLWDFEFTTIEARSQHSHGDGGRSLLADIQIRHGLCNPVPNACFCSRREKLNTLTKWKVRKKCFSIWIECVLHATHGI